MLRFLLFFFLLIASAWGAEKKIPILCYHRFGPEVADSMTIKNSAFAEQLAWLKANGYTVIPLDTAMRHLKGEVKPIPAKPVVITVDDGHKSVYSDMAPLVKQYKIPVTLFVYPSAISNAKYAMSWEQLRELETTKLFRVESHTYWHPNFNHEKKKLSAAEYEKFVDKQLAGAKKKLEERMGHEVKYLAWVFGIYDDELERKAAQAGYVSALTIDRAHASSAKKMTSQPRYMVVDRHDLKAFARMVDGTEDRMPPSKKEVIRY
ncbi:MAG: polysaccharide deacetylase family protein [Campylobacterales bacterium]|nr:polysaccharide deacetylase family protein [Campylobacterales bacterium]